jgi:hypothetical protein
MVRPAANCAANSGMAASSRRDGDRRFSHMEIDPGWISRNSANRAAAPRFAFKIRRISLRGIVVLFGVIIKLTFTEYVKLNALSFMCQEKKCV